MVYLLGAGHSYKGITKGDTRLRYVISLVYIYRVIFAGQSTDDKVIFREPVEDFKPIVGDHTTVFNLNSILGPSVA